MTVTDKIKILTKTFSITSKIVKNTTSQPKVIINTLVKNFFTSSLNVIVRKYFMLDGTTLK